MPVRFFFDFISPYSYLATRLLPERCDSLRASLRYRPVVFGTILSRLNVKGPGEIPARRRHGLADALMLAERYGIPFEGPPVHPFNSIYALRSVCAVESEADRGRLVERYFRAAWEEGRDLSDPDVLRVCLDEIGLTQDPEEAATSRVHRAALKANTRALLDLGGHGVPTFEHEGWLFFGHDRLDLLEAHLAGEITDPTAKLEELLARPQPGRIV